MVQSFSIFTPIVDFMSMACVFEFQIQPTQMCLGTSISHPPEICSHHVCGCFCCLPQRQAVVLHQPAGYSNFTEYWQELFLLHLQGNRILNFPFRSKCLKLSDIQVEKKALVDCNYIIKPQATDFSLLCLAMSFSLQMSAPVG